VKALLLVAVDAGKLAAAAAGLIANPEETGIESWLSSTSYGFMRLDWFV
jgi:hypothetical protein